MSYPQINILGPGTVRGTFNEKRLVARFLNVPVSTVPERWRPATQAEPWEGIYDATNPGQLAPQQTKNSSMSAIISGLPSKLVYDETMSEHDCLGCNIFIPSSAVGFNSEALPVLVFVYGGVSAMGGAGVPMYGRVITPSYSALHSHSFAHLSYIHLIPQSHGLIKRSVLQSEGAAMMPAAKPEFEGQLLFDHLCTVFDIPANIPSLEKVSRLRVIPAKDIAEELNTLPVFNFRPCIDGVLIKEESYLASSNPSNYNQT